PTALYTLSLHDALPISAGRGLPRRPQLVQRRLRVALRAVRRAQRQDGGLRELAPAEAEADPQDRQGNRAGGPYEDEHRAVLRRGDRKSTRLNSSHVSIS